MPTPIRPRSTSPNHHTNSEEAPTTPAATNQASEINIPLQLRGLLRSRSPIRNDIQAARRWAELSPTRSQTQVLERLEGLEIAVALPEDNEFHIDEGTYRELANLLHVQTRDLPMNEPQNDYGTDRILPDHLNAMIGAIRRGEMTFDQVLETYPSIRHPEDVAEMRAAAEDVAQLGTGRIFPNHLNAIMIGAIRRGEMTFDQALVTHTNIRHLDDVAEMRPASEDR